MGSRPSKGSHSDSPEASLFKVDTTSPYVKRILDAREKMTGWERVKCIFELNEFGDFSPELKRVVNGTTLAVVVGCLIGAIGRGRIAHMNYLKSNMHEVFETPLQAKRKLQDTVTLGMGAGAFRVGWRVGVFTGIYLSVCTVISTYRGKMGVLDQVAGAGAAGFLYKLPHSPKASISGLFFGSTIGLMAGVMTLGITKMTGLTIDSANLLYYEKLAKQDEEMKGSQEKSREILREYARGDADSDEMLDLAHFHDTLISKLDPNNKLIPKDCQNGNTTESKDQLKRESSDSVSKENGNNPITQTSKSESSVVLSASSSSSINNIKTANAKMT